jgi:hypothetical protein
MHIIMDHLPLYVPLVFASAVILALVFFFLAVRSNWRIFLVILPWMGLQALLGLKGFYSDTSAIPPRFPFAVLPTLVLIALLFMLPAGRRLLGSLDVKWLTLLHVVRIPVELVLYWLFLAGAVPELMTFEGRNFDIVSGITAPVVFYFGYVRPRIGRTGLLIWNFVCLFLLINIVTHAILSFPSPIQQLAFDQPNMGVLHFPFVWLPSVLVPLVLLSHLVTIRRLLRNK